MRLCGGGKIDSQTQLINESLAMAAGGRISQVIHEDVVDPTRWAKYPTITIPVHVLTTELFRDATGRNAPPCPISASDYAAAGLPFFNFDEMPSGIAGSFEQVKSVNTMRVERGLAHGEEPDVKPRVVKILPREARGGSGGWVDLATVEDPDGLVSRVGPQRHS